METKYLNFRHGDLSLAGDFAKHGKVVAYPTDVCYGMGVNALSDTAIERLQLAKGCSSDTPFIVHVWNKQQIFDIARVSPDAEKIIDRIMPANLTVLLPKKEVISTLVTGRLNSVAIRMPKSAEARKFLQYADVPFATTPACLMGHKSPMSWQDVQKEYDGNINAIVCGEDCQNLGESTLLDLAHDEPIVIRQGAVPISQISKALERNVAEVKDITQLAAVMGGRIKKNDSPNSKLIIHVGDDPQKMCDYFDVLVSKGQNPVLLVKDASLYGKRKTCEFGDDKTDMAYRLFSNLRKLERRHDVIIAHLDNKNNIIYNILSRLTRFGNNEM